MAIRGCQTAAVQGFLDTQTTHDGRSTARTGVPTSSIADDCAGMLDALGRKGRLRRMQAVLGVDFASNDYLGLSGGDELREAAKRALASGVPVGSGGSRLLRGNAPEHEQLERLAARLFGAESALFVSSGFAANAMLLSTLPQPGDLIVHDALVHASTHDGKRSARCEARAAGHNDADRFEQVIREWRGEGGRGRPWLAVESLYSMDGDRAPLGELIEVTRRHHGVLLIDEAHAAGGFGPEGRGLGAALHGAPDVIALVTLGKAFGCEGALILAPLAVREFLVNYGRALIFSTAPSPLMAAVASASLELVRGDAARRERLAALAAHAAARLARHGVAATGSQILPLVLGDDTRAVAVASRLQQGGFDVRAIRPPTVPVGTARLRLSITLNVIERDIDALDAALEEALA